MNKVAIYPGTFDPITYGHIDVIKKSLKLFDKVVVAVSDVENKDYLFTSLERIEIVKKALFSDLKLNKKKINIISFTSLTTYKDLEKFGYNKIYNAECPFSFMDTMSLDGKSNFFEQRVTDYNRPEQIEDKQLEYLDDF